MPRLVDRLTKRRVAQLAATKKTGRYADGEGLYLQITPRGSAAWILVYRFKPKRRRMGLGPVRLVSLDEARAKRDEAHRLLLKGQDPLAHRAVRRKRESSALTFKDAARRYIFDTEAKRKDPKSLRAWLMNPDRPAAGRQADRAKLLQAAP
jgi:hypothetical protein